MSSLVVVLPVLLGTLAMAGISVSARWGLKGRQSPLPFLILGMSSVSFTLALFYTSVWGVRLPSKILPGFWSAVLVGTAANYAIQYLNAKASTIKEGDVSFVAPLSAMTPGLVTILALTLGEIPSTLGFVGIVTIACGTWILLFPKQIEHWWAYFGPVYRLSLIFRYHTLSEEEKGRAKVVWLMFASAIFGTLGIICDGLYVRRAGDLQGVILALVVLTALLAIGYVVQYLLTPKSAEKELPVDRTFFLAALCWVCGWVVHLALIQPTYAQSYIAYVGSLKRLSVLLTIVLGWFLFREEDIRRRLFAGSLMVVGVIFIASDDLPALVITNIVGLGF